VAYYRKWGGSPLAATIFKLLSNRGLARCAKTLGWPRTSPKKLYDIFSEHLRRRSSLTELFSSFQPDTRHISRDNRLRTNLYPL